VISPDDDIKAAAEHSSKAIRLMEAHGLPPTPENYALWYAYATSTNADLNKALDDALEREDGISGVATSDIYARYLAGGDPGVPVLEAGENLSGIAEDLLKTVSQANDEAAVFSTALAHSAGSLAGMTDPKAIGSIVKALAENTQNMIVQNATLQQKLEASSQEVATLKEDLVSVQKEALTDGLTGIANRKCFDMALRKAIEQATKASVPLCLILTDIDHFKKFNDTHGHQTGDHVLRFVATMLQRSVKSQDTAARYGGEEFAVVLPNTDLNSAMALAESVRSMVARKHLRKKQTGTVIGNITLSLGVAKYRPGETVASFLKRADDGLYQAKRTGRNRSVPETELDAVAD
jgi:diguanylate cyclase